MGKLDNRLANAKREFDGGNFDEAVRLATPLLRFWVPSPLRSAARSLIGRAELERKNFERAARQLSHVEKWQDMDPTTYVQWALAEKGIAATASTVKKRTRALRRRLNIAKRAYEEWKHDLEVLVLGVDAAMESRNWRFAEEAATAFIEHPDVDEESRASAMFMRSVVRQRLGKADAAYADSLETATILPTGENTLRAAQLAYLTARFADAVKLFEVVRDHHGADEPLGRVAEANLNLARLYVEASELDPDFAIRARQVLSDVDRIVVRVEDVDTVSDLHLVFREFWGKLRAKTRALVSRLNAFQDALSAELAETSEVVQSQWKPIKSEVPPPGQPRNWLLRLREDARQIKAMNIEAMNSVIALVRHGSLAAEVDQEIRRSLWMLRRRFLSWLTAWWFLRAVLWGAAALGFVAIIDSGVAVVVPGGLLHRLLGTAPNSPVGLMIGFAWLLLVAVAAQLTPRFEQWVLRQLRDSLAKEVPRYLAMLLAAEADISRVISASPIPHLRRTASELVRYAVCQNHPKILRAHAASLAVRRANATDVEPFAERLRTLSEDLDFDDAARVMFASLLVIGEEDSSIAQLRRLIETCGDKNTFSIALKSLRKNGSQEALDAVLELAALLDENFTRIVVDTLAQWPDPRGAAALVDIIVGAARNNRILIPAISAGEFLRKAQLDTTSLAQLGALFENAGTGRFGLNDILAGLLLSRWSESRKTGLRLIHALQPFEMSAVMFSIKLLTENDEAFVGIAADESLPIAARVEAAKALSNDRGADAADLVLQIWAAFPADCDPTTAKSMYAALGAVGTPQTVSALQRAICASNSGHRFEGLAAGLARAGDIGVETLRRIADSEDIDEDLKHRVRLALFALVEGPPEEWHWFYDELRSMDSADAYDALGLIRSVVSGLIDSPNSDERKTDALKRIRAIHEDAKLSKELRGFTSQILEELEFHKHNQATQGFVLKFIREVRN